MAHEDQREFYRCPLCGRGMGNDIDNAVYDSPEHECEVEKEMKREELKTPQSKHTQEVLEALGKEPFIAILSVKDPVYGKENKRAIQSLDSFIQKALSDRDRFIKKALVAALPQKHVSSDPDLVWYYRGFNEGVQKARKLIEDIQIEEIDSGMVRA